MFVHDTPFCMVSELPSSWLYVGYFDSPTSFCQSRIFPPWKRIPIPDNLLIWNWPKASSGVIQPPFGAFLTRLFSKLGRSSPSLIPQWYALTSFLFTFSKLLLRRIVSIAERTYCANLSQCNAERCWSGQTVDFEAVIDSGSDLIEADNTTVATTSLHLQLAPPANTGCDSTAINSSQCNTVLSYSFCVGNFYY